MATTQTQNRKPTHDVLHVRGEGKSAFWTRIGATWLHDDKEGLESRPRLHPLSQDGRLVIRVRKDKNQGEAA